MKMPSSISQEVSRLSVIFISLFLKSLLVILEWFMNISCLLMKSLEQFVRVIRTQRSWQYILSKFALVFVTSLIKILIVNKDSIMDLCTVFLASFGNFSQSERRRGIRPGRHFRINYTLTTLLLLILPLLLVLGQDISTTTTISITIAPLTTTTTTQATKKVASPELMIENPVELTTSNNNNASSSSSQPLVSHQTPEYLRTELWRTLDKQIVFEPQRDENSHRNWLADVDVARDEYEAAFMMHNSLLTHIDVVRCPAYVQLFKWFEASRLDPNRARDISRRVTRHVIQMLAYRVLVMQHFYHDMFFPQAFFTIEPVFRAVAERIEREATHQQQMETWFDLVGCLFEYAEMKRPGTKNLITQVEMDAFLAKPARRRLALRMRQNHPDRDRRMTEGDLSNASDINITSRSYIVESRNSVEAMSDPQTLIIMRSMQARNVLLERTAIMSSFPRWPLPQELSQHDPTVDFPILPLLINRFTDTEAYDQALRAANLSSPSYEPQLAMHMRLPSPTGVAEVPLWRARKMLLSDITSYYRLRLSLTSQFTRYNPSQVFWTKLPLEATIEFQIICELALNIRNSIKATADFMCKMLSHFKHIGMRFHMIHSLSSEEPATYQAILMDIRSTLNELSKFFDVRLINNVVQGMSRVTDLIMCVRRVDQDEGERAESSRPQSGRDVRPRLELPVANENMCASCSKELNSYMNRGHAGEQQSSSSPGLDCYKVQLKCGHQFHWSCMFRWLSGIHFWTCPVCGRT